MNPRQLLQDQSHRLVFVLDNEHTQDMRLMIEEWLKPIRGVHIANWNDPVDPGHTPIYLPTAKRLGGKKLKGPSILVRPLYQDLFALTEAAPSEDNADAIIEASQGANPFYLVSAGLLARSLAMDAEVARRAASKHKRAFEKDLAAALKEIASDPAIHQEYLQLFSKYLELQEQLVGAPGEETLSQNLELLAKKIDRKKNWRLLFKSENYKDAKGKLFYLGQLQGAPIFLEQLSSDPGPLGLSSAALVVSTLARQIRHWSSEESDVKPGHIVQEAFQLLPFPILLLGEKGEVLQYNTAFVRMSLAPSYVAKLKDLDQIQARDQNWTVRRTSFSAAHGERAIFTFLSDKPRGVDGPMGSQELGIITSSIAHELNNPIAGLLTALELLAMDDHWDADSRNELLEMKQGALRCKQLVETFLGFSRIKTDNVSMEKDLLKRCFEQALHLQRFRMVESGLRVNLMFRQSHPFAYPLHAPTATMLAYLVIGELMTAFHHLKLLERRSARGLSLEITVSEDADRFQLRIEPQVSTKQSLNSKLLQFLMQQEKLQLDILEDGTLLLVHQNVLI